MHFAIVTPALNAARFIDEAALSVVTQAGPFTIRYHVQDGGSTDGTLKKLAQWQARLAGDFPMFCEGVTFTYASERDRGIYDAINRGFAACGQADVMSWINADDRYEPGAFATVAGIMRRFPDVDWLSGRTTLLDEGGAMLLLSPLVPLPQRAIAAGVFDGRSSPHYIQQEGTFWRAGLWLAAGGIDARFRRAGDFDLWRRFARQTDLVTVDAVLGCWRQRNGQITADLPAYHAEIDASLSAAEKSLRERIAARYRRIASPRVARLEGLTYRVVRREGRSEFACMRFPPPPQSFIKAAWSLRRHLPANLSVRRARHSANGKA